ncbi:MAG: hypothetical protein WC022_04150 [Parcubacteria group bacterium]
MVKKNKKYPAFSLLELVMAIFILSLITLTAVSVFANIVRTRKNAIKAANDIEAGREAIEIMAKNIRMGSHLSPGGSSNLIYFFSEVTGECISYSISGNRLNSAAAAPSGTDCTPGAVNYTYQPMTRSDMTVTGSFVVTQTNTTSTPKVIGRVTTVLLIDGKYNLQTTISIRNYEGII